MPAGITTMRAVDDMRDVLGDLTPRERDVLNELLDGQRSGEIGRRLGISPKTVGAHRANLLAKLGASNTPRLIARVLAYQYSLALTSDDAPHDARQRRAS